MTVQLNLFAPHNGSATSRMAAEAAQANLIPQAQRVLAYLSGCSDGAIQEEIANDLDLPLSSVNARINALANHGFVRNSGLTRPTKYGRAAVVWTVPA